MISLFPYDLSTMTQLGPKQTGIPEVAIYCGRHDDGPEHELYCIKISIGKAWAASDQVFTMGIKGSIKGCWFRVKGSAYQTEQDVPGDYVKAVRVFVDLNAELLKEWVGYEGIEQDSTDFALRVKPIE